MKEIKGQNAVLRDGMLLRHQEDNRAYLLRLDTENLLRNHLMEAGLWSAADLPEYIHGGWESPTCQLRGHFLGHWLSAAAMLWQSTGDPEIRGKADRIVDRLAECQRENGNGWVGSIPEKYLDWIARGKPVWAPHYTVHKTFMGLVDMYTMTGNETALAVADRWADWFLNWTAGFDRDKMDDILDCETGGMLEIWAELLAVTGKDKYRELLKRYDRPRLFEPLLDGRDPLSNMHANTTVPEVLGCARAYEVTGDTRYLDICKAYWRCAVTERGSYATGGQTSGEIWTPKQEMGARFGDKNQEHCTVYNMMRLADFLFRQTKDPVYADYIERNLYNGILAQGYWRHRGRNGYTPTHPETGLITYFLPMRGGSVKGWGNETRDFWCCHGTLVQANASLNRYLCYQDDSDIYLCQYFNADFHVDVGGVPVTLKLRMNEQTGSFHLGSTSSGKQSIGDVTSKVLHAPDEMKIYVEATAEKPVTLKLHFRIPAWDKTQPSGYITRDIEATPDGIVTGITLFRSVHCEALPDDPSRVAYLYGPITLAGQTDAEITLHPDPAKPETAIVRSNEREWGYWTLEFRTVTEEKAVRFLPLYEIGYEPYSIYFRIGQ